MKKPTLRFRQVFEHPTHFKVTKPLGNPLVIAKKGLSPSLMGRLRKFAEGGVVTPDERSMQFDEATSAPLYQPEPPPRAPTLEEIMANPQFVGETEKAEGAPVEVIPSGAIAQAPIEKLPESERMMATSQMGPPIPVGMAEQLKPVPVAGPAKSDDTLAWINGAIAEEQAKQKPDEDLLKSYQQTREQYLASVEEAPAAAPQPMPVKAEPVVVATPVAAPAVKPPVAPVAVAPVVQPVVAPAPMVKLPEGFDAGKPLTIEAYRAAKAANKVMSDQDVAIGLVKQYAPQFTVSAPDLELLSAKPPEDASGDSLKQFDAAKEDLARAIVNQAKVDYESNKAILEANQKAQAQRLINAEKDRAAADALATRRQTLESAVKEGFNPTSYFGSMDLASKIGSALSVAMGAFASGMIGVPNFALKIYENAVDRDLEVQKSKYNSLINQYNRVLGDAEDAEKLARADLNDLAALQVEGIKASSALKGVGPAADQMIATMRAKAAKEREEVALKQAEAREAKVKADMAQELAGSLINQRNAAAQKNKAAAAVAGVGKGAGIAEKRLEFAKTRYLEGKKFEIADPTDPSKTITIETRDPKVAIKKAQELGRRVAGIMQVEGFQKWLAENADKPVTPDSIKEAQAKITGIVENYPGTVRGSQSLVTVAQSKMLKPAIESMGIPIIRYMDTLGLTSTAMRSIHDDAVNFLRSEVQSAATADDPGGKEFLSKWTPAGYRGRMGYPSEAPTATIPAGKVRISFKDKTGKMQTGLISRADLPNAIKAGATEVP